MSFITDFFSAKSAAKGQQKAADAASAAAADSLAEQRRQYDLTRSDNMPWYTAGAGALEQLQKLNAGDFSSFKASPDYQYRQDEGARALTARNSALGIQDSGAAQKSALKYAGDLANGEYNNYYNKIAGVAGVGQVAAAANQTANQNFANSVTNTNQNKASALGSSYTNQGNIWGNYLSNLGTKAENTALRFLGM